MKKNFVTCKLIFEFGVTKEDVEGLLKKYSPDGTIANFEPDLTVGCNRMAFAVVDVSEDVMKKLVNDAVVRDLDTLQTYSMPMASDADCCGGGGCGSGGCSP